MDIISYTYDQIYSYKNIDSSDLDKKTIEYFLKIKQNNKFLSSQNKQINQHQIWNTKTKFNKERNETYLLLNKLSNDNSTDIINTIIHSVKESNNEEYIKSVIKNTFKVSIVQWQYCKLYVKLLKLLIDEINQPSKYKNYILEQCKEVFDTYINSIFTDISDSESYSEFCENNMKKTKLFGCYQFIGELYNYDILSNTVILEYLNEILRKLEEDNFELYEIYVNCFNHIFQVIHVKLLKDETNIVAKIKEIYNKIIPNKNIKPRIRFMFMDIIDIIDKKTDDKN